MDTEPSRTLLAVVGAGNYINAAVARTNFTPAGRQFQKHAGILVRAVEHARHDVGVPRGLRAALPIGGRLGLWEQLLLL